MKLTPAVELLNYYDFMKYTRLLNDDELSLYSLEHFYPLCSAYLAQGMENVVGTYDLLVRDAPPHRNFLLAGGLEAIVQYIENWRYSEDQIKYLLDSKLINLQFAEYLRNFKFTGDIEAIPEGSIYFPGETLVRITAPVIQANLMTDAMIALATIDTLALSKIARVSLAAPGKKISLGFVRAPGVDAGWRYSRAAFFFHGSGTSNAAVTKRLGIVEITGSTLNANHAFIKSFPTELEAMRAATKDSEKVTVMVDTYDFEQGMRNAIVVADELKAQGKKLGGVTVDSGDLLENCKLARAMLDEAGHSDVQIAAGGNLDEYKLSKLVAGGITADVFLIVTEIVTSADAPKLETVFKMAEIQDGKGGVRQTAKFAPGKLSLPGKKQVFRNLKDGIISEDVIGLEEENLGTPLLVPIYRQGKLVYNLPLLEQNREYTTKQLATLPATHKEIFKEYPAPLSVSPKLQELLEQVRQRHIH